MESVTFSFEDDLLEEVLKQAEKENTTIEELFHRWLVEYTSNQNQKEN